MKQKWYQDKKMPTLGIFSQVTYLMECHAKRLFARFDMKPWQAGILIGLAGGDMSQKDLAKLLNVTPPTITASVRQMEQDGYVERHPDENDQRVMRLSITDKTRQYLDKLMKVGEEMESMVFAGMSVEEQIILKRLLIQVRDNLQKAQLEAGNEKESSFRTDEN